MNSDMQRCAEAALSTVPDGYRKVSADVLIAVDNGHSFHRGMHVAWVWGTDQRDGVFLDFLSEHRHPGMSASRFFANGRTESLPTPASMRQVTGDPTKDAEIEKRFFERNRAAYAWLRARGLLPPEGQNLCSQDINEFLVEGGTHSTEA